MEVSDKNRLKKAVLLWNPSAGKNLKEGLLLYALAKQAGLAQAPVKNYQEIEEALLNYSREGKRHFIVSGGDGTISAFITAYLRHLPDQEIALTVLPGGTNNLIAWDVSRPFRQVKIFMNFLKAKKPLILKRRALKVIPGNYYGLFCAAGLLAEGTFFYNVLRKKEGIRGLKNIFKVVRKTFKKGLKREIPLIVETNSLVYFPETAMLTTLNKLFIPLKPFKKVSNCPKIKIGLFPRKIVPFKTLCEEEVRLHTPGIALDGEEIESPANLFKINVTKEITFLKW
ncbi:diacylglycerol kinase catalytic region [Thermodesulfatator indicus DSM 15286]|uniref:Diacylglycerol kinase catalytic region n=1 Tax=Thermodesulfatator indicus (strain DSM 15286 / JCM 11887 / CIR29812) TaxID=667014 RepID=F8ADB6_THEID|nr:diacylglycerol kinase family protein [Thermodesulfatator indicus]AEH45931.1 diacylglycerol kinase catalytic region [Thermodesulfatator indicus DSM 15286]